MTNIVGETSNQIGPLPVAEKPLAGRTALVVGVANKDSIAYGVARALRGFGADVAMTYLNDKTRSYTEELATALEVRPELFLKCDVRVEGQMESVIDALSERWDKLNVLIHSIAFAPKDDLDGRVTDVSLPGFLTAMEVSVWSLLRLTHLAEALLAKEGGSVFTMSYFGGEKVVPHYGIMGPVKSALVTAAQYMAAELGPKGIRVNIVSPGAVMTRAASGIERFDELLEQTKEKSPARALVTPEQIGNAVAALAADWGSIITGEVLHLDGGYNIMAG
jgi:enoyl-[acyl-carrier protein] reductase I